MVLSRWIVLAALTVVSAGLGGFSAIAEDETAPAAAPLEVVGRVAAQVGNPVPVELVLDERGIAFVADVAEESSPYWIGVQLEPPTEILKQHLNLEGGMVAVHVFGNSPAAKAGLKANDIIVKVGDRYIKEPDDLLKSVAEAKGNELTLVLIRGGKEQTIKVVPAKRPQEANPQAVKEAETEQKEAVEKLELALKAYKRQTADGDAQAVDVLRLRPGVMLSRTAKDLGLPKDVSVTITKEGSSPAKIVVKKDGKGYETTEDKLNELPEDIRGYVQLVRSGGAALGYHTRLAATPRYTTTLPVPAPPVRTIAPETAKVYRYHVEGTPAADENSKLDRILKIVSQKEDSSVSELRKEVQQLRKELAELRQEKK